MPCPGFFMAPRSAARGRLTVHIARLAVLSRMGGRDSSRSARPELQRRRVLGDGALAVQEEGKARPASSSSSGPAVAAPPAIPAMASEAYLSRPGSPGSAAWSSASAIASRSACPSFSSLSRADLAGVERDAKGGHDEHTEGAAAAAAAGPAGPSSASSSAASTTVARTIYREPRVLSAAAATAAASGAEEAGRASAATRPEPEARRDRSPEARRAGLAGSPRPTLGAGTTVLARVARGAAKSAGSAARARVTVLTAGIVGDGSLAAAAAAGGRPGRAAAWTSAHSSVIIPVAVGISRPSGPSRTAVEAIAAIDAAAARRA